MTTVKKGERTQVLHNDVQVAAFKANGWEVVETAAGAKQEVKPKAPAKPKGSKNKPPKAPAETQEPEQKQEQEQEQEPEQEPEG